MFGLHWIFALCLPIFREGPSDLRSLSARLQYLQGVSNGDTAVLLALSHRYYISSIPHSVDACFWIIINLCHMVLYATVLTHCGLMTPYGDGDLGQHWLRWWLVAWWHQAITWTNVDWSSVKSSDIHIRAISQEMSQPSISNIFLKSTCLKLHSNFPGANELIHWGLMIHVSLN